MTQPQETLHNEQPAISIMAPNSPSPIIFAEPESLSDLTFSLPDLRKLSIDTSPGCQVQHTTSPRSASEPTYIARFLAPPSIPVARQRQPRRRSLRRTRSFPRADCLPSVVERPSRNVVERRTFDTLPTLTETNPSTFLDLPDTMRVEPNTSSTMSASGADRGRIESRSQYPRPNDSGNGGENQTTETRRDGVTRTGSRPKPIDVSLSRTASTVRESSDSSGGSDFDAALGASLGFEGAQGNWITVQCESGETCTTPTRSEGQLYLERSVW